MVELFNIISFKNFTSINKISSKFFLSGRIIMQSVWGGRCQCSGYLFFGEAIMLIFVLVAAQCQKHALCGAVFLEADVCYQACNFRFATLSPKKSISAVQKVLNIFPIFLCLYIIISQSDLIEINFLKSSSTSTKKSNRKLNSLYVCWLFPIQDAIDRECLR